MIMKQLQLATENRKWAWLCATPTFIFVNNFFVIMKFTKVLFGAIRQLTMLVLLVHDWVQLKVSNGAILPVPTISRQTYMQRLIASVPIWNWAFVFLCLV